jgi:hypothetical protein
MILSNVNRDGFAASNRKLGVAFDAVYTAEDVGSYKPDPRNFAYMLERLAAEAGLARAWIDRQDLSEGGQWGATARVAKRPEVDFLFPTLAAMAEAVLAEG